MSISGKISIGMRRAAPIPIRQMRIRDATIVYGRFNANAASDIRKSQRRRLQYQSRPKPARESDGTQKSPSTEFRQRQEAWIQSSNDPIWLSLRIGASAN